MSSLTIEQAAEVIYMEASRQGTPLTLDACQHIAKRLLISRHLNLNPGEIAQHQRDRYEEDDNGEIHFAGDRPDEPST
jgi:hypothetical protein